MGEKSGLQKFPHFGTYPKAFCLSLESGQQTQNMMSDE